MSSGGRRPTPDAMAPDLRVRPARSGDRRPRRAIGRAPDAVRRASQARFGLVALRTMRKGELLGQIMFAFCPFCPCPPGSSEMTNVFVDATMSDAERRMRLVAGGPVVYRPTPS